MTIARRQMLYLIPGLISIGLKFIGPCIFLFSEDGDIPVDKKILIPYFEFSAVLLHTIVKPSNQFSRLFHILRPGIRSFYVLIQDIKILFSLQLPADIGFPLYIRNDL